jgi:plasmid replication initiation protein
MKDMCYTKYYLENILTLNSAHAIRLYQLLVLIKNKHSSNGKEMTIDELRLMFGVSETKSYSEYKHFKQRILDVSKREINEKTDMNFSYSEIKKGRKVESIKFKITQKTNAETLPV